jgi:hypothetical protein
MEKAAEKAEKAAEKAEKAAKRMAKLAVGEPARPAAAPMAQAPQAGAVRTPMRTGNGSERMAAPAGTNGNGTANGTGSSNGTAGPTPNVIVPTTTH